MSVEEGYLDISGGTIFFRKWGSGKRLFIALHGFGQDSKAFSAVTLPPSACLVAIDLPWHGRTQWRAPQFNPAHLAEIVQAIAGSEQHNPRFEALGFSYGAGLWLGAIEQVGPMCDKMFLLAPEAAAGRWKAFTAMLPRWLRKCLGLALLYPKPLLGLLSFLVNARFLHPFALRFLRHHLQDEQKRSRLVNTWISLANFPVRRNTVLSYRQLAGIPLHLILGEKDPLVNIAVIKKWAQKDPGMAVHLFPSGHHLLDKNIWNKLLQETSPLSAP